MNTDTDIAILGAGCAGLSLAAALTERGIKRRVLLLEPRTGYVRDRTWCFWNTEPHPFTSVISHRWHRWRVSAGPRCALQHSAAYAYCHIDAADFYRQSLAWVDAAENQQINLGVRVTAIRSGNNGASILETNQGQVTARLVFDSRPPVASISSAPALLQRFVGRHIRTSRPAFSPHTVELMRFLPADREGRVRFLYLLPFSATEALVEMTYLDRPDLPAPAAEQDLEAWCEQHLPSYETLYREQGTLPMGGALAPPAENTHSIGIRGGRLKPSSGYGFLRIQRHSAAIANALAAGRKLPSVAEPFFYRALDALFLRAVSGAPEIAPELFLALFSRSRSDSLVRFLSECSSLPEALHVALKLPPLTMVRALLRQPVRQQPAPAPGQAAASSAP